MIIISSSIHLLSCIIYLFYNNIMIMIVDPMLRTFFTPIFFCQMVEFLGEHVLHLERLLANGSMFVNGRWLLFLGVTRRWHVAGGSRDPCELGQQRFLERGEWKQGGKDTERKLEREIRRYIMRFREQRRRV